MEITEVRVRKVEGAGKLKASASVTFDGVFVVHDLKVIEGSEGLFISMPSRKMKDGNFIDTAHPIDKDFRLKLIEEVLEKYHATE